MPSRSTEEAAYHDAYPRRNYEIEDLRVVSLGNQLIATFRLKYETWSADHKRRAGEQVVEVIISEETSLISSIRVR